MNVLKLKVWMAVTRYDSVKWSIIIAPILYVRLFPLKGFMHVSHIYYVIYFKKERSNKNIF